MSNSAVLFRYINSDKLRFFDRCNIQMYVRAQLKVADFYG